MKFGFQPFLNIKNYREALEFAEKNDFECVEIHMDLPQFSYYHNSWKDVQDDISSFDIEILYHASSAHTNLISPNPYIRKASIEDLRTTAEFAEKTGGDLVTFHLGWNPVFMAEGKAISLETGLQDLNFKAIMDLKSVIKEFPLLSIENTIGMEHSIKSALEELIESTELKITYDIGHGLLDHTHSFFLNYFERIENVHLHDNDGRYDAHLSPGEGIFRIDDFPFRRYKNRIVFEVRPEQKCITAKEKFLKMLKEG